MKRTLVLNASYEPLAVLSFRRAAVLVLTEKAEVLEESDEPLRSATREMYAPSVIRLKRYVRIPYKSRVPLTKRSLCHRDRGVCQFAHCQKRVGREGTTDHVLPKSSFTNPSDAHYWENVVWACATCNAKKGSRTLEQLGWKLIREPVALVERSWFIIGIVIDPTWGPYLAVA